MFRELTLKNLLDYGKIMIIAKVSDKHSTFVEDICIPLILFSKENISHIFILKDIYAKVNVFIHLLVPCSKHDISTNTRGALKTMACVKLENFLINDLICGMNIKSLSTYC